MEIPRRKRASCGPSIRLARPDSPQGGKFGRSDHVTANTVFYASTGPQLTLFGVNVAEAALEKRSTVVLPANVQYAWPHPAKRYLYVVSSDGGPGGAGTTHVANAFRIDPLSGSLQSHGEPQSLPSRPIHVSVDASGEYLLTAYNAPSNVAVHRLNADGSIGEAVRQADKLDIGIYAHQIRTTRGNDAALLVTRGNNAADGKPEDPGALKLFAFEHGALTNLASIAPGSGLGFGPRHLDFHPSAPWVYVSVERQNKLYTYKLQSDGVLGRDPLFVKETLADPVNVKPGQGAGATHVHPHGRFVYVTNRNQDEVDLQARKVFNDGENNVAVFAIDEKTGEPNLIQTVEGHGIQLRTFGIDASGRLLLAASIKPLLVREANAVKTLTAGITVYRINADGTLAFVRKYDVDTGKGQQFWSGMVALA